MIEPKMIVASVEGLSVLRDNYMILTIRHSEKVQKLWRWQKDEYAKG